MSASIITGTALRGCAAFGLLAVWLVFGCGEDPGQTSGSTQHVDFKLSGKVVMPGPVKGAKIEVLTPGAGGEDLQQIATSEADAGGYFETRIVGLVANGTLVIRAFGETAQYDDLAAKTTRTFQPGQELFAAVAVDSDGLSDIVVVDPLSTLAWELAVTYHDKPQTLDLQDASWSVAVQTAASRIAQHVDALSPPSLRFSVPKVPGGQELDWPGGRTSLGLTLAGLSTLAPRLAGSDFDDATPMHLLSVLRRDINDGQFDGMAPSKEDNGTPVQLSFGEHTLDADTTRYELARAIHEFAALTDHEFPTDSLVEELAKRDSLYQSISMDQGPLYPQAPAPTRFDPIAPTLTVEEDTPASGTLFCMNNSQAFDLVVLAQDNQMLDQVQLVTPELESHPQATFLDNRIEAEIVVPVNPAGFADTPALSYVFAAVDFGLDSPDAELTIDYRFDVAPPAVPVTDHPGTCINYALDSVEVTVTDSASQILAVDLEVGDAETKACFHLDGSIWECPAVLSHGDTVAITAADECGQTSTTSFTHCFDNEPPMVELSQPDGWYYTPNNAIVVATIKDNAPDQAVSIKVNKVGVSNVAIDGDDYHISLPTEPDGLNAKLEIVVEDQAGNVGETAAVYHLDAAPPTIEFEDGSLPVFQQADEMSFILLVQDTGSGLAEVKATDVLGEWSIASLEGDQYVVIGTAPEAMPPTLNPAVTITATDNAGNVTTLPVSPAIDLKDPGMMQIDSSFIDASTLLPVYNAESGTVDYQPDNPKVIELNNVSCMGGCPELVKFASRFAYEGPEDVAANNLPVLRFSMWDDCPAGESDSALEVTFAFYHDETLLKADLLGLYPCEAAPVDIPVALPFFSDDEPADASFLDTLVPNRLVVTVTDQSGRQTSVERTLSVLVLPPPLFLLAAGPDDVSEDQVDNLTNAPSPHLETLFQEGGVLVRKVLVNPNDVPAQLTALKMPTESFSFVRSMAYFAADQGWAASCISGKCQYKVAGVIGETCIAGDSYQDQELTSEDNNPVRATCTDAQGGQPIPLEAGKPFLLEPAATYFLDVRTDYSALSFSLGPAKAYTTEYGAQKWLHTLAEEWEATCNWGTLPPKPTTYIIPDMVVEYSSAAVSDDLSVKVTAVGGTASHTIDTQASWMKYTYKLDFVPDKEPF